ncbi:MAG TPA: DUF3575 domain-containing protein [Hymenobacter sp.]|jgi:hypothetical protein|uniref:DUF3575 domain-containing protein n=1 Tax=Hymenobacter sp. TaxID=1898978 RepID=UPI002ED7E458
MKKLLLPALLLLAGVARGQNNAVKLDIFQPVLNTLAISFEHKLSESSSFQMNVAGTFGYTDGESFGFYGTGYDEITTSGFALTPEYRLYLSEKHPALEGFYVAPYLRFQHLSQSGSDYSGPNSGRFESSLNAFGLGVTVGRHWIFKQRFSLDAYFGPGYAFTAVSSDTPGYTPRKGDFIGYSNNLNYDIRGGLTFGVAF